MLKEQAALKAAQEADTAKAGTLKTKTMKEEKLKEVQRALESIQTGIVVAEKTMRRK